VISFFSNKNTGKHKHYLFAVRFGYPATAAQRKAAFYESMEWMFYAGKLRKTSIFRSLPFPLAQGQGEC